MSAEIYSPRQTRFRPGWLIVLPLMGAAIYFSYQSHDYVLTGLVSVIIVSAMVGYWTGAAKMLSMVGGAVLGASLATDITREISSLCGPTVQQFVESHPSMALGACAAGCSFIAGLIGQFIVNRLAAKSPDVAIYNSRVGFLFGTAQGVALAMFVIGGAFTFEPLARKRLLVPAEMDTQPTARRVAQGVLYVSDTARDKPYGEWIQKNNPFDHFPMLKDLLNKLPSPSDSSSLQAATSLAPNVPMPQSADLQSAIKELMGNPQVRQILSSAQGAGS